MSDSELPDMAAFRELSQLIRGLGDEMAAWRRRAYEAEARLRDAQTAARPAGAPDPRVAALEQENAELRARLSAAGERTRALLEKVQFLRQQHGAGAQP